MNEGHGGLSFVEKPAPRGCAVGIVPGASSGDHHLSVGSSQIRMTIIVTVRRNLRLSSPKNFGCCRDERCAHADPQRSETGLTRARNELGL